MTTEKTEDIIYSYTTERNELEEENRILRETINQLKGELDRYRTPPLMVCEVSEIIEDHAIIKIPNGNQFYVALSSEASDLKSGDTVLVDQKNLNIIRKIGKESVFNVEKFVIIEKPTVKREKSWDEKSEDSNQEQNEDSRKKVEN